MDIKSGADSGATFKISAITVSLVISGIGIPSVNYSYLPAFNLGFCGYIRIISDDFDFFKPFVYIFLGI
jgi:hypothetical protein